jgi:hypothetical protein
MFGPFQPSLRASRVVKRPKWAQVEEAKLSAATVNRGLLVRSPGRKFEIGVKICTKNLGIQTSRRDLLLKRSLLAPA